MIPTRDYWYDLPEELIAHFPVPRGSSRLMVGHRQSSVCTHRVVEDLPDILPPNAVVVLNDSKVIKARLYAHRDTGARIELLLVSPLQGAQWTVLIKPARRLVQGERLTIGAGCYAVLLQKPTATQLAVVSFDTAIPFWEAVDQFGQVPLPPYIQDANSALANRWEAAYQTTFARVNGSVAAPTAGLHFSQELLQKLNKKNIQLEYVTLHVGYGTFKPIKTETIEAHTMHEEAYEISIDTVRRLTEARQSGRPVVAVGTTVARTLESAFREGQLVAGEGKTSLFIKPGYSFKVVDALMTNFHLPQSSLLVLVSAFLGKYPIMALYQEAIDQRYRFYSFGDAMLILP